MSLKLSLVLATVSLAFTFAMRVDGTLSEKLAYLRRGIFGIRDSRPPYTSLHLAI